MRTLQAHMRLRWWGGVIVFVLPPLFAMLVFVLGWDAALLRLAAVHIPDDASEILPPPAISPIMTDRNGRWMFAFLNDSEQWCFPLRQDALNPHLAHATIAAEDKRFFRHAGVDLRAVFRALLQNLRHGEIRSGASTLTMQLVKRAGAPPRTLGDKWRQALRALRLETQADKTQILIAYLEQAPYGGNLVGVEAAARRYFGKPATELLLEEAALLAAIPKSPTALNPLRHPQNARQRRNYVLRRMAEEGYISAAEAKRAQSQPLGVAWHAFPNACAHAAMAHRSRIREKVNAISTLDGDLQHRLELLAPQYLRQFNHAIDNLAILVADTQTGDILARVGSAGFHLHGIAGQVDACRAPRAPGSALKPFVYAAAMENHLLYPEERLLDDSLDYGEYHPGNFDGRYNGLVTATEALRWSLNVPAVMISERVGIPELIRFLDHAGIDTLYRAPEQYGLGLALGNCEVTLESLVTAYLALANLGQSIPLRLFMDDGHKPGPRIMSEGVALAVWRMLEQPFLNEPSTDLVRAGQAPSRVSWKTGTSTGFCDAWAIAFNRHYVVGVWLGNSNGRRSHRLVGAQAALPLAAQIFRSLPEKPFPAFHDVDGRMRSVEVCAVTGLPKSPWCKSTVETLFPSSQYLHRRCDVHRPNPQDRGAIVACWPAGPRGWNLARVPGVSDAGMAARPESQNQPAPEPAIRKLEIVSPAANAVYVLSGGTNADRIKLSAGQDHLRLHWYHNGLYLGQSDRFSPLFLKLRAGSHHVSCMSETGDTAAADFQVVDS